MWRSEDPMLRWHNTHDRQHNRKKKSKNLSMECSSDHAKIVMMLVSKGVLSPLTPDCYVICTPASLIGESESAEKTPKVCAQKESITDYSNIAFMGSL